MIRDRHLRETLARYYHTLRPLTLEQITFRPVEAVRRRAYARLPALGALHRRSHGRYPDRPLFTVQRTRPLAHATAARVEEVTSRHELTFGGETGPAFVWNVPSRSRLWSYHVHYLRWLVPLALVGRTDLVRDAVADHAAKNPIGSTPAWEPYPTALRTVSLVYLATLLGPALGADVPALIATHASYLRWNLERHLLGNHLLEDLKALAVAGAFLSTPEAGVDFRRFAEEIERQILPDGGHVERTPMYHALVLGDVLEVAHLARATGRARIADDLAGIAAEMSTLLESVLHGDGEIPCFGDSGTGVAPSPAALLEGTWEALLGYAPVRHPEPPEGLHAFQDFGLFVARDAERTVIIDAGALGAPYLAGHGHSDALSFELSLGGRRVVVDRGVRTYQPGPERDDDRAGPAHNSLTVHGEGPDELWASFRAARRGTILFARLDPWRGDGFRFSGAVRSYRGWLHERFVFGLPGVLAVYDSVDHAGALTNVHTFRPELVHGNGFTATPDVACVAFGRPEPCTALRAPVLGRYAYVITDRPDVRLEGTSGAPVLLLGDERVPVG